MTETEGHADEPHGQWFKAAASTGDVTATFSILAGTEGEALERLRDFRTQAHRTLNLEPSADDPEPFIAPATPTDVANFALGTLMSPRGTSVWLRDYRHPPVTVPPAPPYNGAIQ